MQNYNAEKMTEKIITDHLLFSCMPKTYTLLTNDDTSEDYEEMKTRKIICDAILSRNTESVLRFVTDPLVEKQLLKQVFIDRFSKKDMVGALEAAETYLGAYENDEVFSVLAYDVIDEEIRKKYFCNEATLALKEQINNEIYAKKTGRTESLLAMAWQHCKSIENYLKNKM